MRRIETGAFSSLKKEDLVGFLATIYLSYVYLLKDDW
jgi:hypothetical protein